MSESKLYVSAETPGGVGAGTIVHQCRGAVGVAWGEPKGKLHELWWQSWRSGLPKQTLWRPEGSKPQMPDMGLGDLVFACWVFFLLWSGRYLPCCFLFGMEMFIVCCCVLVGCNVFDFRGLHN